MDAPLNLPECSICTDFLDDPRQLPCGHCYCGPHKPCLEILKNESLYRCAICKIDHQIIIEDLKPMYGLRDFLEEQQDVTEEALKKVPGTLFCSEHPKFPVKFWCKNCECTMCIECSDDDLHSDHDFISFSKNIKSIVNSACCKILKN